MTINSRFPTGIGELHNNEIRLMEIDGYVVDAKPTRQL